MDWTRGYSCQWRLYRVDPNTWADAEAVGGMTAAKVTRTDGGPLESGSIDVTLGGAWEPGYYRIAMAACQDGAWERVDVATLLCEGTGGTLDRGARSATVTARSVLHPASVRMVPLVGHVPAGEDGAQWAASLLRRAVAAPVVVEGGGFALASPFSFDRDVTYLDAAWEVLAAGGRTMQVDGRGAVHILPKPTEPALSLDVAGARLLVPGVKLGFDMSAVPNRYTAISGVEVAQAVNDDPDSPTSTVARGYVADVVDRSPKRLDGETLQAYAERRLSELSTVGGSCEYAREWWPGVLPGSTVRGSEGTVGEAGDLRVTRQDVTCGRGVTVTERAEREVRLWP